MCLLYKRDYIARALKQLPPKYELLCLLFENNCIHIPLSNDIGIVFSYCFII